MLHFLICDDHALMRQALESTIRMHWPRAKISIATDFESAQRLSISDVDLCICDLKMPGADPINGLRKIVSHNGPKRTIAISGSCDQSTINAVLALGVHGLFDKSLDGNVLETAIRTVLEGGTFYPAACNPEKDSVRSNALLSSGTQKLTSKQVLILKCLGAGKSNKEIAKELNIAPSTVKFHVDSILERLNAKNRAEAVSKFLSRSVS